MHTYVYINTRHEVHDVGVTHSCTSQLDNAQPLRMMPHDLLQGRLSVDMRNTTTHTATAEPNATIHCLFEIHASEETGEWKSGRGFWLSVEGDKTRPERFYLMPSEPSQDVQQRSRLEA